MTKVASPVSTGGGGSDYEKRVGAYYLAALLLGSVPRGLEAGITREVRFQRLFEGEPLDDLVIIADLTVGEVKLALQVKRDLTFGEKDETFDEVILACWETFKSPKFNIGIDRFGIVIALYSKNIDENYQSVLSWARNSANAGDFLKRIAQQGLSNKEQRKFVELIRKKLDSYQGSNVSDDELWQFLRSMVILYFDFQREGSRDYTYTVEIISQLLSPDKKADSPQLFAQLVEYAAETNRTAGSFNTETLRQRLQLHFALVPSPDCRADLQKLQQEAEFVLQDIRTDIGGLTLSRTNLVAAAREMMRETRLLELVGSPGAGKSAVLKALVEIQQGEGPVILFAGDRMSGTGWSSYANDLQLTQPLAKLLLAASSSPQPAIFIDGIDKIFDSGRRKVVNDLLRSLANFPLSEDGSRHWTVVVSVREENLQEVHTWIDLRVLGKPKTLAIPELTTEELQSIIEHSPRLKPLLLLTQLEAVIKNPFMLSLLEDQRMLPDSEPLPPIATEIEVSEVWWERVVGEVDKDRVLGIAKRQALLKLGRQVVNLPGNRLLVDEISPDALISLESDQIISRVPRRDVYRFRHDLLEDWVICRVLDQNREELVSYLQKIGQPIGLFRAVQLLGASLLEKNETDTWVQLVRDVEQANDLSPRWRQALLTAPLISPRAPDLLDQAEPLLVSDDAQRLTQLLVALRTVEVNPDFSLLPFLKEPNKPLNELLPILMLNPVPVWRVWLPLMRWLVPRLNNLPSSIRPEAAKLMEIWQTKTPVGSVYRREIGELAVAWMKEVERNYRRD
ncbi:hypothetical protein NIES593_00125 [Hydrococcus rivularis NIES-593]|uniref:AAA+ ATPase domain-containing protein n=1 Tax=Hydrococcus rivularis NIES-593 TaxID=1921803 RepID=A0A1U7HSE2_9CYAN|nr:ATP-binding protein [Hydrococcus rivularis]OKH26513.1 hypothetical protein NIES593_00125 [Hydrococcus rivularis NIES-593]